MSNYVQSAKFNYPGTDSLSSKALAFASNVTAGNLLVMGTEYDDQASLTSVTDSQGNTWHKVFDILNGGHNETLWYAKAGSSAACTVTITYPATVDPAVAIAEYANVDTLDASATQTTGTGTSITTPSITTSHASETIIEFGNGPGASWSCSGSYATRQGLANGGNVFAAFGDRDVTSIGTYAAAFTAGSLFGTSQTVGIASFYKGGGGSSSRRRIAVVMQ